MVHRLISFAPIALLCTVACWQLQRAHSSDLSPWKGGGFGMFSTVDQPASRFVKAFLTIDDSEYPLEIAHEFKVRTQRVKADPSEANLSMLMDKMEGLGMKQLVGWARRPLQQDTDLRSSPLDLPTDQEAVLRVELWRLQFDHHAGEIRAHKYMEMTRNLQPAPSAEVQ